MRSKLGSIGKVTKIEDGKFLYENKTLITWIGNVVKHSPNIIDLIEAGDLVIFKIGSMNAIRCGIVNKFNDARSGELVSLVDGYKLEQVKILSIVTKEQMQSIEYRVEE